MPLREKGRMEESGPAGVSGRQKTRIPDKTSDLKIDYLPAAASGDGS